MEHVDGASKKRKICHDKEDEEEEDDEVKMETFFALVRSMRETRDRWINFRSGDHSKSKEENRDHHNINNNILVWKPKFQVEDFAEEEAVIKCPTPELASSVDLSSASASEKNKQEDSAKKGTNINLSLSL